MIETAVPAGVPVQRLSAAVGVLARALRVRQWTKNLLLFAALLFAAKLGDAARWGEAWLAFGAYCAASSAAYLVNDVRDVERDRLHPTKRRRPVASGALARSVALALAAILATAAVGGSAALGAESVAYVAAFLVLQLAYSFGLKRIVGLDVISIALLFSIRAAAGARAIDVRVSPWLLACTALLALFLALAKRRGELALNGATSGSLRPVLTRYSLRAVDRSLFAVAAATACAYTLYALGARHSLEMAVTIPFVIAAIARYFVLIHRDGLGEEPEEILLGDAPILVAVAGWAVTAGLVLTLT